MAATSAVIIVQPSREELLLQGLSPPLVDFILRYPRGGAFEHLCGDAHSRYPLDAPWVHDTPANVTEVYRLWNRDADQCVLWLREGERQFAWLYHDGDVPSFISRTEQGLVADLLLDIMDVKGLREEEDRAVVRQAAQDLGCSFFDLLWDWDQRNGGAPTYRRQRADLIEKIDDMFA